MILAIDILLLVLVIITFKNFHWGFFIYVISGFFLPPFVYFKVSSFQISIIDLLLLSLLLSFFYNKNKLYKAIPTKNIKALLSIYVISTAIFIPTSSYVPVPYQLYDFLKGTIFHTSIPIILSFYAFSDLKLNAVFFKKIVITAAIVIGFYGIFCYVVKENPYMKILNLLYFNEYRFEYFIEEARGGLESRISGTTNHPLTWGQLWGILMGLFIIKKNEINIILFYALMILSFLNILFSGSRTALLSIVPLIVFYGISQNKKIILRTTVYVLLGACILSFTPNIKSLKYIKATIFFWDPSYSAAADINGSSVSMRQNQLDITIKTVMKSNPITGFGLGYRSYSKLKNTRNEDMLGFESIVFTKLFEQGIGGLICFFIFYLQIYRFSIKRVGKNKLLLKGYFFSYLLSIIFTGIQNSFGWFVYIGLFITLSEQLEETTKHAKVIKN